MKIKTGFRDINNYDGRVCNYGLSGTTDETPVRFFRNWSGSEKVASMVATFLNRDINGLEVSATKTEPEKVDNMVTTFLNKGNNGYEVSTTQTESKKVANVVATFLSEPNHNN